MSGDISPFPQPPAGHVMNAAGQTIFTIAVSIPMVIAVVWAVRLLVRDKNPLLAIFLVGGALCIFMEPVVDVLGQCLFPRTHQWVGLEVFGRPIPVFMWPVYSWFIGGQGFLMVKAFQRGLSRQQLWKIWGAIWVVNIFLESPGILMDVYTYYGKQPFNPWGLPLWWPPVNATMPIVAGFAIWKLMPHLTGPRLLLIIPILPMCDGLTNGATGLPVWTALNTRLGFVATYPAAVLTLGLALTVVWALSRGLPQGLAPEDIDLRSLTRPIPVHA